MGVKPLFYILRDGYLLFASEIKALLAHPYVDATLDATGLAEGFGLGPGRTPEQGVFKDIKELRPGHCAVYSREGFCERTYWQLTSKPHEEDLETMAHKVRELFIDTIHRQLVSDVPVCTLLSEGLE